ncbi:MAG: hypothetical protein Kow0020_11240 [Wenzhouxiangellaceae bacterium]
MNIMLRTICVVLAATSCSTFAIAATDVRAETSESTSVPLDIYEIVVTGHFGQTELPSAGARLPAGETVSFAIPLKDGGRLLYTITAEKAGDSVAPTEPGKQRVSVFVVVEYQDADGVVQTLADPGATIMAPDMLSFDLPGSSRSTESITLLIDVVSVQQAYLSPAQLAAFQETGRICAREAITQSSAGGQIQTEECCSLNCSGDETGSCCVSSGPATCCACGDCCNIPGPGGGGGTPITPSFCSRYPEICDLLGY